jgi:hypothetical protein
MDTLGSDRHGQEVLAAWIATEKLRDVLTCGPASPAQPRASAASVAGWPSCTTGAPSTTTSPSWSTLARTISRWEDEIVAAVLTGVTNARSESLNRLAKLEARMAYSFRNPANQRRRVRTACTRAARRSLLVTGRQPNPGYWVTSKSPFTRLPSATTIDRSEADMNTKTGEPARRSR